MKREFKIIAEATALLLAGCAASTLAPGAADVKIVRSADAVAGCTAVGNFKQPERGAYVDPRNDIVGLGGNTLFVTEQAKFGAKLIESGVAYHCPR